MQVVFINDWKSCDISNRMFFIVMFSFSKQKMNWLWQKIAKKVFNRAILQGASNELEAYLEPINLKRGVFCKNY